MSSLEVQLNPFPVPDSLTIIQSPQPRQNGFSLPQTHLLGQLSDETLIELCDEFKASVLQKAVKQREEWEFS